MSENSVDPEVVVAAVDGDEPTNAEIDEVAAADVITDAASATATAEEEEEEEEEEEAVVFADADVDDVEEAVAVEEEEEDGEDDESNAEAVVEHGNESSDEESEAHAKKRKASDADASEADLPPPEKRSTKKSKKKAGRRHSSGSHGKIPAVKGLTIPFRNVKRTMKLDKDIGTVQNEAAIVATYAVELFVKKLAKESLENAKKRGRNTIRYEDVAEARASDDTLSFLDTLLP